MKGMMKRRRTTSMLFETGDQGDYTPDAGAVYDSAGKQIERSCAGHRPFQLPTIESCERIAPPGQEGWREAPWWWFKH
jgi:hypothetical protein